MTTRDRRLLGSPCRLPGGLTLGRMTASMSPEEADKGLTINRLNDAINDVLAADDQYHSARENGLMHAMVVKAILDGRALLQLGDQLPEDIKQRIARTAIAALEVLSDLTGAPAISRLLLGQLARQRSVTQQAIASALTTDPDCPIEVRTIRRWEDLSRRWEDRGCLDRLPVSALPPDTKKHLRDNRDIVGRVAKLAAGRPTG